MSIPTFGPSQRLEISRYYLNYNEAGSLFGESRLYDTVRPSNNFADEGQVVLLRSDDADGYGRMYSRTEVIPDAAGYPIEASNLSEREKALLLLEEMKKYRVGINQVERCVGQSSNATGYGWDISHMPGQIVTIKHTGHEPIYRFDKIGVRFPNKDDVQAQEGIYGKSKGASVSKFATYPVYETGSMGKHETFIKGLQAAMEETKRLGGSLPEARNPLLEYIQVPALLKLMQVSYRILDEGKVEALFLGEVDFEELLQEEEMSAICRVSQAACRFVESLTPPFVVAQCIDFRCTQAQGKVTALCGDQMTCVLL